MMFRDRKIRNKQFENQTAGLRNLFFRKEKEYAKRKIRYIIRKKSEEI
jgi:hypothetical protein